MFPGGFGMGFDKQFVENLVGEKKTKLPYKGMSLFGNDYELMMKKTSFIRSVIVFFYVFKLHNLFQHLVLSIKPHIHLQLTQTN